MCAGTCTLVKYNTSTIYVHCGIVNRKCGQARWAYEVRVSVPCDEEGGQQAVVLVLLTRCQLSKAYLSQNGRLQSCCTMYQRRRTET